MLLLGHTLSHLILDSLAKIGFEGLFAHEVRFIMVLVVFTLFVYLQQKK